MKWRTIAFFFLCIAVGLFIVVQSKITNGMQLYVSAKTITDYQTTIASEIEDTARIEKLVQETERKLAEYEEVLNDDDKDIRDKLLDELNYYKLIGSKTRVKGEGVVVIVDDGTRDLYEGEDPNSVLVHDMDLLTIINDLNRSGAEVLAVNGQRVTNTTSISCSGYTVRINGQFFARPFEIRAIGDSKRMAAALIGPDGYGTLLQDYGVIFKVTIRDELTIPLYPEDQNYKYTTKVSEGE
jgi:uncharacterized protein YlxW (UPF0749 family)